MTTMGSVKLKCVIEITEKEACYSTRRDSDAIIRWTTCWVMKKSKDNWWMRQKSPLLRSQPLSRHPGRHRTVQGVNLNVRLWENWCNLQLLLSICGFNKKLEKRNTTKMRIDSKFDVKAFLLKAAYKRSPAVHLSTWHANSKTQVIFCGLCGL